MQQPFDTPLQDTGDTLAGPLRSPRQMLATQQYDDHHSIHDDATAQKLGFKGALLPAAGDLEAGGLTLALTRVAHINGLAEALGLTLTDAP